MKARTSPGAAICVTCISTLLGCGAGPADGPPEVVQGQQPSAVEQDQPVVVRSGVLVFRDAKALQETLAGLSVLDADSLRAWNRGMGFVSLREVFDEVVREEAALDEHYERLAQSGPEAAALLPTEPVHSEAYHRALRAGRLRVVAEDDGEYFDYNLRQVHLAPILDPDGRVSVGGVLMQYGPAETKQVSYEGLAEIEGAKVALAGERDTGKVLSIIPTVAQCRYYSGEGNGWYVSGSRRYRAWVEEDSRTEWLGTNMYVTNVLRIQGMKRNWLGQWKFSETYSVSVNLDWYWWYRLNGLYQTTLPVPASSKSAPWADSLSYVNNASISLAPHINGYYSVPEPNYLEPVVLDGIGGTVVINGYTLQPGLVGGCTIQ
ncbi:MAG TPA: hypothetical protein VFS43_04780 [Polyangiaceae bacterium]|nr:hypothetical protein [Polyangiaceae bacterium]